MRWSPQPGSKGEARMKRLVLSLLGLAAVAAACSNPTTPTYSVPLTSAQARVGGSSGSLSAGQAKTGGPLSSTHLDGSGENPANASQGQGQAMLTVSEDGTSVSFKLIA